MSIEIALDFFRRRAYNPRNLYSLIVSTTGSTDVVSLSVEEDGGVARDAPPSVWGIEESVPLRAPTLYRGWALVFYERTETLCGLWTSSDSPR